MADNPATQPDQQPPDDGPQLELPEDGPKAEAGEPERGEKRNSLRPQKADKSIWITAAISGIAALAGVLIGAFTSHYTTQLQPNAKAGAAKPTATAKAKTDLISKKQKDYADYYKNERALVNTETSLVVILRSAPDDFANLNATRDQWNKDTLAAARSDLIMSFGDSDKEDNIRQEISRQTDAIHITLAKLVDQAYAHQPIDQPGLQDLDTRFAALRPQFDHFTDQAKADLRLPNGGLPHLSGCD